MLLKPKKTPKSFQLFARKFQVIQDEKLLFERDLLSDRDFHGGRILFCPSTKTHPMDHDSVVINILMEMYGIVCETLKLGDKDDFGLDDLKLFRMFSQCLHQVSKTAAYRKGASLPYRFDLMGRTFTVVWDESMPMKHKSVGMYEHYSGQINLVPLCSQLCRSACDLEVTFLHEIVHMVFTHAGYHELNENEHIINLFANCWHQMFSTMEYQ